MSPFLQSIHALSDWFSQHHRVLPWRENPSLYRVWISEIMLQQTTVEAVIPYFERFMVRFPNLSVLANSELDEVLLYWAGLGYYSRARNLHKTAKILANMPHPPETRYDWERLPGVGRYTAGAILSIALNIPEALLDANVKRVLCRLRKIENTDANKKRLWRWSEIMVKAAFENGLKPSVFNQSLMELGSLVCKVKNPLCTTCPLQLICLSGKEGSYDTYTRKAVKLWKNVEETRIALLFEQTVVLAQTKTNEWRQGLWDLLTELPIEVDARHIGKILTRHTVTHHKILRTTEIYRSLAMPKTTMGQTLFPLNEMETPPVALGSAAKKTLAEIAKFFSK